MNRGATWLACALLAFLSCGCEWCRGAYRVARLETDPEFIRDGSQGPPVQQRPDLRQFAAPDRPAEDAKPKPGNALTEISDNPFDWKTFHNSPRVHMPVTSAAP